MPLHFVMDETKGTDFNFDDKDRVTLRLEKSEREQVDKAVERYAGLYESKSHFIRCAVIRELRRLKEMKNGK